MTKWVNGLMDNLDVRYDYEEECFKPVYNQGMYNHILAWMELIATPENARKLRARVDRLVPPQLNAEFGPEPPQCPTTVLYGAAKSAKLYADPRYRQAMDMWDTGEVTPRDLKIWCLAIEKAPS